MHGEDSIERMRRGIAWYAGLAVLLSAVGSIAYFFYFRGYVRYLSDQSSSFTVELSRIQARMHPDAKVLVLGNSTAAEGFLPNYFNQRAQGNLALNLGIPGGYVYTFDRMLAMAAREGVRPKAVILMLTPDIFSDRPDFDFMLNDLTMLKTILSSRDLVTLATYTHDPGQYAEYASPIALRPVLFRAELRDFLAHPAERLASAKRVHEFLGSFHHNSPMPETNNSFSVCDAGPLDSLPATIERLRHENDARLADFERVRLAFEARRHQPLKVEPFDVERVRRLLQKVTATRAAVYVVGAPFYDPDFEQYPAAYRRDFATALQQVVRSVRGVTLLAAFPADCSMMEDTVHLNRKGGERFTEYLRTRVL
jgi:hypothetical protein